MRNFQTKKSGWRRVLESTPSLFLLFVLVLIFSWSVAGFLGKMQDTEEKKNNAEEKVIELREKKEKLSGDIVRLETDKGIEENIRGKFGLIKEGEGVIVIVEEDSSLESEMEAETGGFWSFFKNWFK